MTNTFIISLSNALKYFDEGLRERLLIDLHEKYPDLDLKSVGKLERWFSRRVIGSCMLVPNESDRSSLILLESCPPFGMISYETSEAGMGRISSIVPWFRPFPMRHRNPSNKGLCP